MVSSSKEGFDPLGTAIYAFTLHDFDKNQWQINPYVGYTKDLKKRLTLHNTSKGAKFTKGKKWKIIYSKRYNSKSMAMKNEYLLKKNFKKRNVIKSKYINK